MTELKGWATYAKGDNEGRVPAVRVRLAVGIRFTDQQILLLERELNGLPGVVRATILTRRYHHILFLLVSSAAHQTDAGMIESCRAICRAANITIIRGPEAMPG